MGTACATGSVHTLRHSRQTLTPIEPYEAVAVIVSQEATGLLKNAEDCVTKALKDNFPELRVISSDKFYDAAFPDFDAATTSIDFSVLLKESDFRERIARLGLRYLVSIEGGTQQTVRPFGGLIAGPGAGGFVLGLAWDRKSNLSAWIWELTDGQAAGSVWASASGAAWAACVVPSPFCAGVPVFTEPQACDGIGEGVVAFVKGGELPAPLWINLAPRRFPSASKIDSTGKIALTVVDKRTQDFLGYWRGPGEGKIRASNRFDVVLRESLQNGLSSIGFEVSEFPIDSASHLEVSIENFEYWAAFHVNVDAYLKAVLYRDRRAVAEKVYTINNKFDKPGLFGSLKDTAWIEDKINASLSDLILKLLADRELLVQLREQNDAGSGKNWGR